MAVYFISDLHLTTRRPGTTALFHRFLATTGRQADALYILGDLFDAWLGDDISLDDHRETITALRRYRDSGIPVFFLHGNRDFLIGTGFARASGATILPEYHVLDLHGCATLLCHGDTLCTDDHDYQQFRRMVREPHWQQQTLARPPDERRRLATCLRDESITRTRRKPPAITDVSNHTVMETMHRFGVTQLIHGHTHRPDQHHFDLYGTPARRTVLGDWHDHGTILVCEPDQWTLTRVED